MKNPAIGARRKLGARARREASRPRRREAALSAQRPEAP
jgi:hypothetical protein